MDDNFSLGYAMGQNSNGNNGGGWGMNGWGDWILIILLFAILGGGFGGFGFGGFGGFGGGAGFQGMATRADINEGFALNNITSGITAIQQGICDSTYALNNSIMQGFHGVDNAVCNLGYNMQQGFNTLGFQTQQGFNTLGYAVKDCCCETQRMIERGICDTNYNLATNANNIVQSGRADTDRVIAKLDQMEATRQAEKIEALRMENQTLRFQASQAQQNAFITANQEAQTAELIRRLGADCPVPSYLVNPPTPVNFPTNCCGTVQFSNRGGCSCNQYT